MSNSIQISSLQDQISSKNQSLSTIDTDLNTLYVQQATCSTNIELLEQELVELLFNTKKLVQEFNHMEELTSGDASPMGRIQFVKTGVLEGTALESIQTGITEQRQEQKNTLTQINNCILQLKTSSRELEEDIEQEKKQLITINQLISNNQQRIHQLRADIISAEGRLRTLT